MILPPNPSKPPSTSAQDGQSSQNSSPSSSQAVHFTQERRPRIPKFMMGDLVTDDEGREQFRQPWVSNSEMNSEANSEMNIEANSEMNNEANSGTDDGYWIQPGSAEIVIEVMGEHVPEFLLKICGLKLCESRKRSIARALCIGVVFSISIILITTIMTIKLRKDSTVSNIIKTDLPSFPPLSNPSSAPSYKPSFSPLLNDDRSKNITKVIFDVSGNQIYNPVTPQGRALRWIMEYDEMNLIYNSSNILQRYTVMVIFYALNGPNWFNKKGYKSSQHECNWYGVIECKANVIQRIDLENNGLRGMIPDEIYLICPLKELNIGNNRISGTIPVGFEKFKRMLKLSVNKFTGTIPNSLKSDLIDLGFNMLTGTIPSSLMNNENSELLKLQYNLLTGTIPNIVTPSKRMNKIMIDHNKLSGSIPSEIKLFTALEVLGMSNNNFNSTIPTNMGNLIDLEQLFLNDNNLSGSIPSELGLLTKLEKLEVQNTMITGVVPDSVCQLMQNELQHFIANFKFNCSCCTKCF